jgi:hypothetical protein
MVLQTLLHAACAAFLFCCLCFWGAALLHYETQTHSDHDGYLASSHLTYGALASGSAYFMIYHIYVGEAQALWALCVTSSHLNPDLACFMVCHL